MASLPDLEAAYDELLQEAAELGAVWLELKTAGKTTKQLDIAQDQVRREANRIAKKIEKAA